MTDLTLLLVGVVGGLLAGISPCVLPVLPVVLVGSAGNASDSGRSSRARPVAIVSGLVLSFALFTLFGTVLLSLLHLPADLIRWLGIAALVVFGLALLIPPLERLLERPFALLPQRAPGRHSDGVAGGFALGVALGAVYVPCAGPVLATIAVAGATDRIGPRTLLLTAAFAIGTAIPLLAIALTGHRLADRVRALQRHQRTFRMVGGVVVIALAVALALNVTEVIQRRIPDYTQAVGGKLGAVVAPMVNGTGSLQKCQQAAFTGTPELGDCGRAPELVGIDRWLGSEPKTLAALRGKVVLIDFWAYSCINCQRELPHAEQWWKTYRDSGFEVIGVHTPEYAFERDVDNVTAGARKLGLTFPIAIDNKQSTWGAYRNVAWPAGYLIDAAGNVRLVTLGEGDYQAMEASIRSLLLAARPDVQLPDSTALPDTTPRVAGLTPEIYLGIDKQQQMFAGTEPYEAGTRTFTAPQQLEPNRFGLAGAWNLDAAEIRAVDGAAISLRYRAQRVYLNVGGTGTLTVTDGGGTRTIAVSGPPDVRTVVDAPEPKDGTVTVALSPGLTAYSFTFG